MMKVRAIVTGCSIEDCRGVKQADCTSPSAMVKLLLPTTQGFLLYFFGIASI